jgi:hypothetical protein
MGENIPNYNIMNSFCLKNGHSIPKWGKITTALSNGHKIFQMTIKYTNIFHSKALLNLPQLGFLV